MDWLRNQVQEADAEFLREAVNYLAGMFMDAEVSAMCGTDYRESTEMRTNSRNGYR